jgi:hypothetical protein
VVDEVDHGRGDNARVLHLNGLQTPPEEQRHPRSPEYRQLERLDGQWAEIDADFGLSR